MPLYVQTLDGKPPSEWELLFVPVRQIEQNPTGYQWPSANERFPSTFGESTHVRWDKYKRSKKRYEIVFDSPLYLSIVWCMKTFVTDITLSEAESAIYGNREFEEVQETLIKILLPVLTEDTEDSFRCDVCHLMRDQAFFGQRLSLGFWEENQSVLSILSAKLN